MRPDLLPKTFHKSLSRLLEECGEVLKAIGKIQRFGLSATDKKTKIKYENDMELFSELDDLEHAIKETRRLYKKDTARLYK